MAYDPHVLNLESPKNENLRLYEDEILVTFRWPLRFVQALGYVNIRDQQPTATALSNDEPSPSPRPDDDDLASSALAKQSKGESQININWARCWSWARRAPHYCKIAVYQVLVISLQLFLGINYWTGSSEYSEMAFRPLDRFDQSVMFGAFTLQIIWPICVKLLHGLVSAKQASKFWRTTASELGLGIRTIRNPNSDLSTLADDHKRSFRRLFTTARNATIVRLVIMGVYSLLHSWPVLSLLSSSAGKPLNLSRLYPMTCEILWNFVALGHVALSVWISNFLKLYATCFEILSLELEKLLHEQEQDIWFTHEKGRRIAIAFDETPKTKAPCRPVSDFRGSKVEERLTACIRFYYRIEAQLDGFNSFFGPVLIGEILWHIALGIIICFYLHLAMLSGELTGTSADRTIAGALFFSLFALAIHDYCSSASRVHTESKKVLVRLQDISLHKMNSDLRQMVHVLITKITACPPEPSPGMYFTINRSLITSIVSALCTYLVVLIQFRSSGREKAN